MKLTNEQKNTLEKYLIDYQVETVYELIEEIKIRKDELYLSNGAEETLEYQELEEIEEDLESYADEYLEEDYLADYGTDYMFNDYGDQEFIDIDENEYDRIVEDIDTEL